MTGPFKVNGVPVRRVNARYVIATKTSVNLNGLDEKVVGKFSEDNYFRQKTKADKGEDAFFKQGEKREVSEVYFNLKTYNRSNNSTAQTGIKRSS